MKEMKEKDEVISTYDHFLNKISVLLEEELTGDSVQEKVDACLCSVQTMVENTLEAKILQQEYEYVQDSYKQV